MDVKMHMNKCDDGSLEFVIRCSNPDVLSYKSEDLETLINLDKFVESIGKPNQVIADVAIAVHGLKDRYFNDINREIKKDIQNKVDNQIKKICTELYNWIYDHQKCELKKFMQEFNPERVCYFFNR